MSSGWMPLYVGDYLADTPHLNTLQHGAYLLLIMHYWTHAGLPTDERELARICRLSRRVWVSNCLTLAALFQPGWRHKRIDVELKKAYEIREKRSYAGRKGGAISRGKDNNARFVQQANAKQTGHQSHYLNSNSSFVTAEPSPSETLTLPAEDHAPPRQNGHASPNLTAIIKAKGWTP